MRGPQAVSLRTMSARKNNDYRRLDAMVAYGSETNCHRAVLLRYFGESWPPDYRCRNCSACSGGTSDTGQAAAVSAFSSGNEIASRQLRDTVLAEPLEIVDGMMAVPQSPGLGVAVDRAKVEKYQVA